MRKLPIGNLPKQLFMNYINNLKNTVCCTEFLNLFLLFFKCYQIKQNVTKVFYSDIQMIRDGFNNI